MIYDPMRDELFSARRGGGARLNGAAIKPSEATALANSTVEVGWNVRAGVGEIPRSPAPRRALGRGAVPHRLGRARRRLCRRRTARRLRRSITSTPGIASPRSCWFAKRAATSATFSSGEGLTKGNPLIACAPGVKDALISAAAIEGIVL